MLNRSDLRQSGSELKRGRMMKCSGLMCALAAATLVGALLASAGSAQQPGERTFKLIEEDASAAFGDVTPRSSNQNDPRFSGGDMHVFTSKLFDETNARVGQLFAQCITVRGGRSFRQALFQCSATIELPDGTISLNTAFRGNQHDEDVLSAVTGGTGAYEGARGSISQRNLPQGRMENTVHLLP